MGTYPDMEGQDTTAPVTDAVDPEYAQFLAWKASQPSIPETPVTDATPTELAAVQPSVESEFENNTYVQSLLATIENLKNSDVTGVQPAPGYSMAQEIASMQAAMAAMKAEFETKLAAAAKGPEVTPENQSGPPVPHHLHLDDGRILQFFDGIATHIANADGTISKVVAHFPSITFPKEA